MIPRCLLIAILCALAVVHPCAAQEPKGLVLEDFEDVSDWTNLEPKAPEAKVGHAAVWRNMTERPGVAREDIPHDWSAYDALSLWVYNARKLDQTAFMMILPSENEKLEGPDYYAFRFDLSRFEGWKHFVLPFAELGAARSPIGWGKIDAVRFTASGWGNTPNPEALVYFDEFKLLKLGKVRGPRMTDEEFFHALNLDYPGLEQVKAAVQQQDWPAAKAAFKKHLQNRKRPVWHFDWRARPKSSGKPEGGSEGWDYYSRSLKIDWEGWKQFTFTKQDFGAVRKPIGWHWITYVEFSATYSNRPRFPETILHFDDFVLKGPAGEYKDGLETVEGWRGLERSADQVHGGEYSGKWRSTLLVGSVRAENFPRDWTGYETFSFWVHSAKATGQVIQLILNSDTATFTRADEVCRHIISGHDFGPDPDWATNIYEGYREWTYGINRFYHWNYLGDAYWQSGDEKYAKEFDWQVKHWVAQQPVPLYSSGNGTYTWRTIECGIRMSTTWPTALYRFLGSENFTPEGVVTMVKSMVEHARHLSEWLSRGGNWVTMECNGLGHVGILFPEFKEAEKWRQTAFERLDRELDAQVYPDGAQKELTTGYHQVALRNFLGLAGIAKLNDVSFPGDYYDKLERMFWYDLWVMMPDGRTPGLNDGGMGNVRGILKEGYDLYERPEFLWAATSGAEGTPPDHTSHAFPWAGQFVMRSAWDGNARYLILDAGPFGLGHQHEDKLSVVSYGYGKVHLVDPGNYRYDSSPWRRYTIDTPAHNTIMIDGQPQRRRGQRGTYVVEKPLPNQWITTDAFDYVRGRYADGYGDKRDKSVTHQREILFVKPDYWLILDTIQGTGKHRVDSLFHFDAQEAEIDPQSLMFRTIDPGVPNSFLLPLDPTGWQVRDAKGQTEPTIQGFIAGQKWRPSWKNPQAEPPEHGKREIPTAVYSAELELPAKFALIHLVYPDDKPPDFRVERLEAGPDAVAFRAQRADGSTDIVMLAEAKREGRTFGGWTTDARAALVRVSATGEAKVLGMIEGSYVQPQP